MIRNRPGVALTERLSVRVTPKMHAQTHATAVTLGVTASEFVEFLIETPNTLDTPEAALKGAILDWRIAKEN
jgi:hypothetical protein